MYTITSKCLVFVLIIYRKIFNVRSMHRKMLLFDSATAHILKFCSHRRRIFFLVHATGSIKGDMILPCNTLNIKD